MADGQNDGQTTSQSEEHLAMIFRALSRRCPKALAQIRDGDASVEEVRAWARNHNLEHPDIPAYVARLRLWWAENPNAAARLDGAWAIYLNCVYTPFSTEEQEFRTDRQKWLWPRHEESLKNWTERAVDLWRRVQEMRGVHRSTGRPHDPDRDSRYADWFVQYQVQGLSVSEICCTRPYTQVDESTVRRGIRLVSKRVGIQLRVNTVARIK